MDTHFDDALHTMALSDDGSYTAYSQEYEQHYHSTKDGALHESLFKHVLPALEIHKDKKELYILDICFGLGFNTLATLYYIQKNHLDIQVHIYSPELDASLLNSLKDFSYPKEFSHLLAMLHTLLETGKYKDESIEIELFVGDAREYTLGLRTQSFDIVYQDAFSPSANPMLWTQEYFADIGRILKDDGVITTYSMALATRLALHENGFLVYVNSGEKHRDATVASRKELALFKKVDMQHKIACNPQSISLRDE